MVCRFWDVAKNFVHALHVHVIVLLLSEVLDPPLLHVRNSCKILIGVHEMHGQMHPN